MEILIRKAKKGDAKGIAESFNEGIRRGLSAHTGTNAPIGPAEVRDHNKTLAKNKKNEFSFVAIDEKTGKIVGSAVFAAKDRGRIRHRGEIGWGVHPEYRRKSIATRLLRAVLKEAKRRGFKRAGAEAAVENIASVRLAKRCGFKIEGRRKAGLLLDNGKYVDTYIFGKILK